MPRPRRRPRREIVARFGATLVRVDEPEVIYLTAGGSAVIIAIAIEGGLPGSMKFFGSEVSGAQWKRYLREEVDLRYLLRYPRYRRWFVFDLSEINSRNKLRLRPQSFDNEKYGAYLPAAGFFARSHTNLIEEPPDFGFTQSFEVDGSWSLQDFSRFYSKVSDIYVFFSGLKNWSRADLSDETRRRVKEAFLHPWRGGFSYVAFFGGLFAAQPEEDRLAVRAVQYASPGHVDVDGHMDVFAQLKGSLHEFGRSPIHARDRYNEIYNSLSKQGYLRLDSRKFSVDAPESELFLQQALELGYLIGFEHVNDIHELADRNALVTLKIVMTLARRTDDLFTFFAEGRAKLPDEDVVTA